MCYITLVIITNNDVFVISSIITTNQGEWKISKLDNRLAIIEMYIQLVDCRDCLSAVFGLRPIRQRQNDVVTKSKENVTLQILPMMLYNWNKNEPRSTTVTCFWK